MKPKTSDILKQYSEDKAKQLKMLLEFLDSKDLAISFAKFLSKKEKENDNAS